HDFKFHSGIVSSEQYRQVFECEMLPRYGVGRTAAAYLVEQETSYGVGLSKSFSDPTSGEVEKEVRSCRGEHDLDIATFGFPRDIGHLRNAYRESGQSAGTRNPGVLPSIDFTLKDPTRGEDSIPAFSETGSSMTQSA